MQNDRLTGGRFALCGWELVLLGVPPLYAGYIETDTQDMAVTDTDIAQRANRIHGAVERYKSELAQFTKKQQQALSRFVKALEQRKIAEIRKQLE